MAVTRRFVVEGAGCESCAERVRNALSLLGTVDEITVDEKTDRASVLITVDDELHEAMVTTALARASDGSGHEYRLKAGSWDAA